MTTFKKNEENDLGIEKELNTESKAKKSLDDSQFDDIIYGDDGEHIDEFAINDAQNVHGKRKQPQ